MQSVKTHTSWGPFRAGSLTPPRRCRDDGRQGVVLSEGLWARSRARKIEKRSSIGNPTTLGGKQRDRNRAKVTLASECSLRSVRGTSEQHKQIGVL